MTPELPVGEEGGRVKPQPDRQTPERFEGHSGRDDEWVVAVFATLTAALTGWAVRSGARPPLLLVGVPAATAVLRAGELMVPREVFGRFTWR